MAKENVPAMLREADLLILHQGNIQWGSSNKLYDYMASGKPIISSVFAKHNDVVTEIGGGVSIPPENPEKLAEAILGLKAMSEGKKIQMGKRNRNYVKKLHDWTFLSQRLYELVKEVTDK